MCYKRCGKMLHILSQNNVHYVICEMPHDLHDFIYKTFEKIAYEINIFAFLHVSKQKFRPFACMCG